MKIHKKFCRGRRKLIGINKGAEEKQRGRQSCFRIETGYARAIIQIAILSLFAIVVFYSAAMADDFATARDKIKNAKSKSNIDYNTFCKELPSGEDKIACRLKSVETIGLLVCKKDKFDGKSCEDVIKKEIGNLERVKKARLKTIVFKDSIIESLKCGEQKSAECAGYLVRWVTFARFVNLDDTILNDKVADLADEISQFTPSGNLSATRRDIMSIVKFMTPGENKFSRICDLQGFYLREGGFLINDVPSLQENVSTRPDCFEGAPRFDAVLEGLNDLADRLKPQKSLRK